MILAHNNSTNNNYPRTQPFYLQDTRNTYVTNNNNKIHNGGTSSHNFDVLDSTSIASSPLSNYSYQPSTPLVTGFDVTRRPNTINDFKFPSAGQLDANINNNHTPQSLSQIPDLMPSTEQWLVQSYQQTPRGTQQHLGHNRESSLSSLNSNGPASPYNANTSNPQIAINDSTDGFNDLTVGDSNYTYQIGKPMTSENFYTSIHGLGGQGSGLVDMGFADGLSNMAASQQHQQHKRFDRGLLPAADVSSVGSTTRSHPASVASSTAGGDSQPATPSFQEPAEDETRRRKNVYHNAPKLDRTMTDVYSDELYSPHFTITSASPQPQSQTAMSPNSGVFAERLALANNQHLSAVQSPASSSSRTNSPFRHGSPLAPSSHDFPQIRLNSAQQVREKQKQEHDANALQEQLTRTGGRQQQQGTPSTISPKDAMLDFNDSDEASNFPLFPPQETSNFDLDQLKRSNPQEQQRKTQQPSVPQPQQQQSQSQSQPPQQRQQLRVPLVQQRTPLQTAFDFSMPSNLQMPQQYPFVSRPRQQQGTPAVSHFSRMGSAETNGSSGSDVGLQRPAKTGADGGTYTCTYHGCTLRFETPQLLQKHKREGHRQANALTAPITSPMPASPGVPDTLLGSQAGPHRCDRINPSTGKPCATVFSRPYDLTRHEDTIHNARKKKVRCNLCTEEKTFSRADALTRHYRVCHPDVEFPGKHRRRGGSAAA